MKRKTSEKKEVMTQKSLTKMKARLVQERMEVE